MILFDSHNHLDDSSYKNDMDDVVKRAGEEGVKAMMVVGVDLKTALKAVGISKQYQHIYTSVGIHPHDARQCSKNDLDTLRDIARQNSCVKAWGETGLDFNRMFSPARDQEKCLTAQLEKAGELNLPLIFHERDSNGRFLEILTVEGPESRRGVIHCFSGTKKEMFRYLDLGYHIGITGILTLKERGEYLRSLVPHIPENRILIETDAPYLTPAPQKNKTRRNEPGFVKQVLLKLAEIRETDPDVLAHALFDNTLKLYGIEEL